MRPHDAQMPVSRNTRSDVAVLQDIQTVGRAEERMWAVGAARHRIKHKNGC